jgi:aminoglycoside phosphotransferase family enzyme/predicted kinase
MSASNAKAALDEWVDLVTSLQDCEDWGPDEQPVEIIHTHISVVFLGARHVLKLKKPLDLGFLDFTSLEKRRNACLAEVELNRRLCADCYIGVQPIRLIDGRLRLSGQGQVVEYGVWMKRLPGERMLDRMIAGGEITEEIIGRVATRLSDFHRSARRGPEIDACGSLEVIARNWRENFDQTRPYIGRTIARHAFEGIRSWVEGWLEECSELFDKRVAERRICDGHGDIRAESICVTDGLCIFDCIEFNERFRFGDIASEVAFLAMDLHARGRPDLGYYFAEQYERHCADPDLFRLLPFYRCYRAYVRGKVQSFRLGGSELTSTERESVEMRARRYFELAACYASRLRSPTVIVIAGLPGTGKTSIARAIAGELGLRVVSSDAVRKSLFEIRDKYEFGAGPYGSDASVITYRTMIERGREFLRIDDGVVLDATFRSAADRALARTMAEAACASFRIIECKLSSEAVRERLKRREERREGLSDANWEIYLSQSSEYDAIDPGYRSHLELDTSRDLAVNAHIAANWLRDEKAGPS